MSRDTASARQALHPATSAQTEAKLTARHVQWEFEPNLDIARIRDVEGNQVRLSEHRAPRLTVQRYTEQMKAGAIFPAIVVNEHHEIVDGNSRWLAAQRNKRSTIAAYICSGISALEARSLSVELNQSHGQSMTEDELRAFVTSAVEEGQTLDAKSYSRMTGVKAATLGRWLAVKHCQMRASQLQIPAEQWRGLSDSVLAALHVAKLSSVFTHAMALAGDAKASAGDMRTIITRANAAGSEAEALAVLAQARTDRTDDIKAIAAGFKSPRRRSAGCAMHIGGLMAYEVADLLDVAPDKQPEMYAKLNQLQQQLAEALGRAREEWTLRDAPGQDLGPAAAGAPNRDDEQVIEQ